ncbi:MAG: TonB-dependent receptor plug domain-containing protein, partial [Bacteroidia bacterium]
MIRQLSIFLLLQAFFTTTIYAQPNQQTKTGRITGKITDANTQKPVEFASVTLLRPADSSIVSGALTSENGQFELENIAFGKYVLKVQSISYSVFLQNNISLSEENPAGYYPKIAIKPLTVEMDEVVIEGEKRLIQTSIDRKIFNVDQIATTQGGTATDVLQQVPSVAVDNDGNITLRGSGNVTIFIDGKPSTLSGSLENIPASSIEKVELLTNPSAKYDPQGMAGIINIVLKKERKPGYNGNITANVGTGNKTNASTSINYNYGKVNTSAMYSFRYNDVYRNGNSFRRQFLGEDIFALEQKSHSENLSNTHMIRLGLDYNINRRNSLGFSGSYNNNLRRDWENITYKEWIENGLNYDPYSRRNKLVDQDNNFNASINYTHKFLKEGREFSAISSVSSEAEIEDMHSQWMNTSVRMIDNNQYALQNIVNGSNNLVGTFQADYVTPLVNNRKFETG